MLYEGRLTGSVFVSLLKSKCSKTLRIMDIENTCLIEICLATKLFKLGRKFFQVLVDVSLNLRG